MKKLKYLILLLPFFIFTGCTSYTELNELGIVSLLGIDYQNQKYHLYINIVEGNQEDGTLEKESIFYETEAETLDQAFQKLYAKSNKKIYLSHMDCLLLTENAMNTHLRDIIIYLLNQRDTRNNFELIQTQSDIKEIFKGKMESKDLMDLIKTNEQYMGTTKSITFEEFLEEILIDQNTYLPLISYQDEFEVEGISLIQNFKVLDYVSKEDTILINLLKNQIHQAIYQDTTIYKNQTNLTYKKNQVTFHIQMEVNKKNQHLQKELEEELKGLINQYQEKEYDILKLSYQMKQNHLFSFQNRSILPENIQLKFEIQMKTVDNYLERELPI